MATAERSGPSLAPYYLILFGLTAGLGGVVVLLAELKNELGFSNFGIGLAISSGFATAFVASLLMAPLADRGRAPLMLRTSLILGGLSLVTLAVGDELWHYVLGRSLYGFALGTGGPAVRRTVIVADPKNLGRNLGRLGAFDVAGFMVSPLLVTGITAVAGFRASFWALAAFLFLLLPASFKAQTDSAPQDTERLGLSGLLRIRRLVGALVMATAYFVFIGAFESVWILEMDFRGADQTTIGIALTLAALPMPLLSPLGGVLAQRYGARRWAVGTMAGMVIIIFFYGLVPGVWWLVAAAASLWRSVVWTILWEAVFVAG
ncbi:MAG: MFS transporter [Acidimicrobiales bacterium]